MTLAEQLTVLALLLGPVFAVQAQKYLDAIKERGNRKGWVFHLLMASRANRLSTDHVTALNSIDLVFFGRRVIRWIYRTEAEEKVLTEWHEYLDHLSTPAKEDQASQDAWNARGQELFIDLLVAMATERGFVFDRVQIAKGVYFPTAHGDLDLEQRLLRRLGVRLLAGETRLKMDVMSMPSDPQAVTAGKQLRDGLLDALSGKGALHVTTDADKAGGKPNEKQPPAV